MYLQTHPYCVGNTRMIVAWKGCLQDVPSGSQSCELDATAWRRANPRIPVIPERDTSLQQQQPQSPECSGGGGDTISL